MVCRTSPDRRRHLGPLFAASLLTLALSACHGAAAPGTEPATDASAGASDTAAAGDVQPASSPDAASDATSTVLIDATSDSFAQDTADVPGNATEDAAAAQADATTCVATVELCDGQDNDCDGATDEGFQGMSPQGPVPLGSPCGGGGVVVCVGPTEVGCSTGEKDEKGNVDFSAILAPANAAVSPLLAKGGFVDVSAQSALATLKVDLGAKTQVANGSVPLVLDVDGDNDLDLIWLDGQMTAHLWTQTAPWQFKTSVLYQAAFNLTAVAALSDGAQTRLLLSSHGFVLLERDVTGQFVDVAAARGLVVPAGTQALKHLLPADVNGDGLLDVVAGVFSCSVLYPALYVFVDRGDGHYREQAAQLGFNLPASVWASLQTDLDADGMPDLFMLTESCEPDPGVALWHQQALDSAGPPYQTEKLAPVFTAPGQANSSPMGAACADVNGDGLLDYLLSEIEVQSYVTGGGDLAKLDVTSQQLQASGSNAFLLSQPDGTRKLAGLQAGLWAPLSAGKGWMVAWTPIWSDLDHDGHVDLLLSHAPDYGAWTAGLAGTMRPVYFRNDGTQHFTDASAAFGLPAQHDGRTMLAADLDGDGDLDLVLGGQGVAARLLRNDILHQGSDVHVRLQGKLSNPWGLMARLQLQTNKRTILMEHSVQSVPSSMALPESHFALQPGELPQQLTVKWPSGWTSQQLLTKPGAVTVAEPALFTVSSRWSEAGATPVVVTAQQFDPTGAPMAKSQCAIELASGAKGQWQGPTLCSGATCTRTWQGNAQTQQGADAVIVGCGGKTWSVRPRIGY